MKVLKKLDYLIFLKYIAIFICYLTIYKITPEIQPFGLALSVAFLYTGTSLIATPILSIGALLILGNYDILLPVAISEAFFIVVFLIYRINKTKPKFELCLYVVASLVPFIMLSGRENFINNLIISSVIFVLALVFTVGINAVSKKGLKLKLSYEEIISLSLFVIGFGLGTTNLCGPNLWKAISILVLLTTTYIYRFGISTVISAILSLPLCIFYKNFGFTGIFVILSLSAVMLSGTSRYLSSIAIILTDFLLQVIFSIYPSYTYVELIYLIIPSVMFVLIPTKELNNLKEKLYIFRERQLARQSINRSRYMLSNRLYEIASVFLEIGNVFIKAENDTVSEDIIKKYLIQELKGSVCMVCDNYNRCRLNKVPDPMSLEKLFNIGIAKGKISFIDVPVEISNKCVHGNNMIFCVNKLLAEYRNSAIEKMNINQSKQLIGSEAIGVADILKGLALETSQTLKYQNKLERKVSGELMKGGINASEILIYGEGAETTISMIITSKEVPIISLQKIISDCVGTPVRVVEKSNLSDEKMYFIIKPAPKYDAVFGIASAVKDGSTMSGDTHSVLRISEDKFLVALSDGMGSGEKAENVSNASLSLIESFYKAGMKSDLILETVNKVLSINTEDSFTALDISVINLRNLSADFIKFGCPYGFIITGEGIKMIEGNGLPIGILSELKPTVYSTDLAVGDMLLLFSDGIENAFKSSSNFIDFIRQKPALNPQTLCDDILNKAINLNDNKNEDDMTCVAVRIYDCKTA